MNKGMRRAASIGFLGMTIVGCQMIQAGFARAATPTTWVVTSTLDSQGSCASSCTLRSAIVAADASAGPDSIVFNIAPGGPVTISVGAGVASGLPAITGSDIVLDGSTQPGGGAHGVRLDDPDTDGGESGFVIESGARVTIRGFAITRFDAYGILIRNGSSSNLIAGNLIGTRDGTTDDGTANDGIHIIGGSANTIGGSVVADRNVVSGGNDDGIQIEDSNDNVITGNYVGLTADGANRLPNADSGIEIDGLSSGNRVGGWTTGERNVASGNDGIGVQLLGTMQPDHSCHAPTSNVIVGNYLGLNANGARMSPYGNLGEGAQMSTCALGNRVGGPEAGARNLISGNHADGLELDSSGGPGGTGAVCNNTVQGNYIGTDPTGKKAAPNVDDGVGLDNGACNNVIGGLNAGEGNVLSGNYNDGIDISRNGSAGNVVRGNLIGLGADGTTAIHNNQNGVNVRDKASGNTIESNVISANLLNGVAITASGTNSNAVRNNKIGTDATGTLARGNQQNGVRVFDGPKSNSIESNVFRSNVLDGVAVERSTVTTSQDRITKNVITGNGGLGIDLLPSNGVNANDGTTSTNVGNLGLDFPVISGATSAAVQGTAPAGATVEVFHAAPDAGETNGEADSFLGSVVAASDGSWCLGGLSYSGSVTATATDTGGDTSEFSANRASSGSTALCGGGPSETTLFTDDFTGADGTAPFGWEIKRSAGGAGAGAVISSNQLRFDDALTSAQSGSWQYVQACETSVQPSWSAKLIAFRWQMTTDANASQSAGLVLTPAAATGNALSASDYFRVRIQNGTVSILRRVGAGSAVTLWSGPVTMSSSLRSFELRIDATNVSLSEGPPGSEVSRVSDLAHGLSWTSGFPYLHTSADVNPAFMASYDAFRIVSVP